MFSWLIGFFRLCMINRVDDPLYVCEKYKKEGCPHVDGYLCDVHTCNIRKQFNAN